MHRLNVFKQNYCPWKYPSNWRPNFRLFFRQFKWAYQRATRGYCDYDVWDLDSYYLDLFFVTLNHLADTAYGYPGTKEFPTYEDWQRALKEMAWHFFKANESNDYFPHPAEDKWWEAVKNDSEPWSRDDENSKAMLAESYVLASKRDIELKKGLEKLNKVFRHLWD